MNDKIEKFQTTIIMTDDIKKTRLHAHANILKNTTIRSILQCNEKYLQIILKNLDSKILKLFL